MLIQDDNKRDVKRGIVKQIVRAIGTTGNSRKRGQQCSNSGLQFDLEHFQGVREVKTVLIIILKCHLTFFFRCPHVGRVQKQQSVQQLAPSMHHGRGVKLYGGHSGRIRHDQPSPEKKKTKKMPVLLKNALNEAVEMINFIKSQPWILLNLFNILCAEMGIMYKAFLWPPEASWLSGRKQRV